MQMIEKGTIEGFDMRTPTDHLYYTPFAVGEKLHCLWDCNLPELNSTFLDGIDPGYFSYLADLHGPGLLGPNKRRAAVALHSAYFHGLEALFSLIFAGLFARNAIPAWIAKCGTSELRDLVSSVISKQPLPFAVLQIEKPSWKTIAGLFNDLALREKNVSESILVDFGKLWLMFARDYVDGFQQKAYNSFKHGFRIRSGGMAVTFRPEGSDKAIDLGSMDSSMTFFVPSEFKPVQPGKNPVHLQLAEWHVNCFPEYAEEALHLISISITNVIAALKFLRKEKPSEGLIPDGANWLKDLRARKLGALNLSQKPIIDESEIKRFRKEDVEKQINRAKLGVKVVYENDTTDK